MRGPSRSEQVVVWSYVYADGGDGGGGGGDGGASGGGDGGGGTGGGAEGGQPTMPAQLACVEELHTSWSPIQSEEPAHAEVKRSLPDHAL